MVSDRRRAKPLHLNVLISGTACAVDEALTATVMFGLHSHPRLEEVRQLQIRWAGIWFARRGRSEMTANLSRQQPLLWRMPALNVNLSRFQTVVGLAAGVISNVGALLAVPNYFKPAIGKGALVAVLVDAKTEKAVSNATVEILTLNNAVVTTLNSGFFGRANSTLDEGQYRIRIKHPKFGAEVRHVQIMSGQTAEIRVQLHWGPQLHEAINDGVNAVKRLFSN